MTVIYGHICKIIIFSGTFFIFLKFWFSGSKGVKGQKMVQNDKKFCLSRSRSQEPYIIWLSFMIHMCKIIISPGVFFHFFKIFIFRVVRGVKRVKNSPKWQKVLSIMLHSQEPCIIWLSFMVHMCNRIISPGFFTFIPSFYFGSQ